jgi:hypothetical protein
MMIRIGQGSIFDTKCDLLVVPCDSAGGVTPSVRSNLKDHGLPVRVGPIPYGNVYFREVRYENASALAYAASVNAMTVSSSREAISRIAGEIRGYCRSNSMLAVNIPLLGSGAGGMNAVDSYLALKDVLEDDGRTEYTIFCFTREQFQNISAAHDSSSERLVAPRVFISYAGADPENAAWVKALAVTLRQNGIDARLDVFHLKPGFDLPQWMTNEVILAEKVLLICDGHYMQKADFRKGGVGWETMIIQGDMLAQGDNKQKYIAIIREEQAEKALPIYIRSKFALNWGKKEISGAQIQELVLHLFNCDFEPELGAVPSYVASKLRRNRGDGRQADPEATKLPDVPSI